MAKLNLFLESQNDYLELARDLLSPIGLELQIQSVKGEGSSLRSIKSNRDGGFENTHEACVEIITEVRLDSKKAKVILNKIQNYQSAFSSRKVYVIIFQPVAEKVVKILEAGLTSITKGEFRILDSNWVEKTLNENPELLEKYNIKEGGESKPMTFDPDKLVKYTSFIEAAQKRQIFLSHHIWGSQDKLRDFLINNYWQPQDPKRNKDLLEKIEIGNLIILNSSNLVGEDLQMKVMAIGVVRDFAFSDGQIEVSWKELNTTIVVPDRDAFTNSFSLIQEGSAELILARIHGASGKDILNILDELTGLVPLQNQTTNSISESSSSSIGELIQSSLKQKRNFWWLHAKVDKWRIDELEIGQSEPYRATDTAGKIHKNFHELEVGDLVFGYQGAPDKKIKGIFEVDHKDLDSHISFKLLYRIQKQPTLDDLRAYPNFKESTINKVRVGSMHSLTYAIVQEIIGITELNLITTPESNPLKNALLSNSGYNSDAAFSGRDLLNIENDVRAFALLLASSEVNPPLAIALFGKWGSGKSFFMKHLEKRIKELSTYQAFLDKNEPSRPPDLVLEKDSYCKGVAHIWFNAWSYLDSNLWAGLAHSLFEKLNEYITDQSKGEIEKLKVQVRLAKRLQILHSDLENFKEKKEQLETLKHRLNEAKDQKVIKYFYSRYQEEVKTFLTNNGIPEKVLGELTPGEIKAKIELGTNLWGYLKRNSKQLFLYVIPLMVILFLGKQLLGIAKENMLPYLHSVWMNISAAVAPVLIPVVTFYNSKKDSINKLISFITELSTKTNGDNLALEKLQEEIAEIDPVIEEIEDSIEREYSNNADITQLAIANFVSTKSNQKEYTDKLGIVSIIRKDFETLSELFHPEEQEDHSTEYQKKLNEDRTYIEEQFKEDKNLERIILYIDDLDRCADNKVLEVIQAVHLLMAFPLFNVVVGVDNRCIHNALNYQYMLRYHQFQGVDKLEERIHEIKPEEYIEKIFQIPFKLKEASSRDIENLVDHLLEHQVTNDDEPEDENDATQALTATEQAEVQQELKEQQSPENIAVVEKELEREKEEQLDEALEQIGKDALGTMHFNMIEAAGNLKLSKTELAYIKAIAFLVGNTPRTIKRFINIYRIIRSHEQLEYEESKKNDHFLAIMFLLAIEIGNFKELAPELNELVNKDPSRELSGYIKDLPALLPTEEKLSKNVAIKQLLSFKGELLIRHLPFVRRFSFGKEVKIKINKTETAKA